MHNTLAAHIMSDINDLKLTNGFPFWTETNGF